jgi:hypothetical protein
LQPFRCLQRPGVELPHIVGEGEFDGIHHVGTPRMRGPQALMPGIQITVSLRTWERPKEVKKTARCKAINAAEQLLASLQHRAGSGLVPHQDVLLMHTLSRGFDAVPELPASHIVEVDSVARWGIVA